MFRRPASIELVACQRRLGQLRADVDRIEAVNRALAARADASAGELAEVRRHRRKLAEVVRSRGLVQPDAELRALLAELDREALSE